MILLAETNFVLELVFSRDKFASCNELIELAERHAVSLSLPAYSIIEPYEAIVRRRKSRLQAYDTLTREIREITRSMQFQEPATQLAQLTGLLIQVGENEQDELRKVIARLLQVASVIDLNKDILQRAMKIQADFSLSPQDAVVFSSVVFALEQNGGPACFITKNSKDFSDPRIDAVLDSHGCKLLFDFEDGLNYVRSKLSGPPTV